MLTLPQCVIQPKVYELKVDRLFLASAYERIKRVGTWAMEHAQARVNRGCEAERPDLFQAMMDAKDPKGQKEFRLKEMWTESMLLLVAGEL